MIKPTLTIAIPFYDGFNTTSRILFELASGNESDYEILIIDDCSSEAERTLLNCLIKSEYQNSNIRLIRNAQNLGMDLNFEKCVTESSGTYTWFLGQDDFIPRDKLEVCLKYLDEFSPDVVYVNYRISRTWKYNIEYVHGKQLQTSSGYGLKNYYEFSNSELPFFLPALILKKELWPSSNELKSFYGTHFIQLASFIIIISSGRKWLYIGEPLAIGEIPATGWQSLFDNLIKYYVGFMTCLDLLKSMKLNDIEIIVSDQRRKAILQHVFLTLECRTVKNPEVLKLLKTSEIFSRRSRISSGFISAFPMWFIYLIQKSRNFYYTVKNKS